MVAGWYIGSMNQLLSVISKIYAFWQRRGRGAQFALVVAALFFFGLIRGLLVTAGLVEPTYEPKQAVAAVEAPPKPRLPDPMMQVRPYLRQHLNDWDSYDSRGYSEPEAIAPHGSQPAWRVRHTYRAKNRFNATVLEDQMFYYTASGVYLVLDVPR